MSSNNARIVEKDVFLSKSYATTQGGDSDVVDLNFASKLSVQSVFTVTSFSNKTFTDTNVNTTADTITITSHGFVTGMAFTLTTSGTLPSPLAISTTYYAIVVDANTIQVATSLVNALAGTAINLTTAGGVSNTQTVVVTALSCNVAFWGSNDNSSWTQLAFRTDIQATGTSYFNIADVSFRYIKAIKTITGGAVALTSKMLVVGDSI